MTAILIGSAAPTSLPKAGLTASCMPSWPAAASPAGVRAMLVSEVFNAGTVDPCSSQGARQAGQDGLREAPDAFGNGKGGIVPHGQVAAQPLSQAQETGWCSAPSGKAPI